MGCIQNKYIPLPDLLGDLAHFLFICDRSNMYGAINFTSK
jgi:hypothetical protein